MAFSRTSLGSVDLNLLSALIALVEERSTVRAAARLHLAQSTVSGILARLREVFDDEILVRNGRVLEPTVRALELVRTAKPHMDALAAAVGATLEFDPGQDHRAFHLGCTDGVAYALLPKLTRILQETAPQCELVVRIGDFRTLPDMLATGEITTAVGYLRDNLSATTRVMTLFNAEWVVIRDAKQPPVTGLEDFCDRPHAIVTPRGNLTGFVDEKLAELGRSRHVAVGLSQFSLLLATLTGNDLIATVPDFIARSLQDFGGFAIDPCPVDVSPVANRLAWVSTAQQDPSQIWFRDLIKGTFQGGASKLYVARD
ncbi:MAG: LysR family transcriptional regulator [Rhodobacterales bacterium]|nr:MAG: LysR family transcriptional regulator [Rhodobacterales bacterium]